MSEGLAKTFGYLEQSRNESTEEVLSIAFHSQVPDVRQRALQAILKAGGKRAVKEIIENWFDLDEIERQLVLDRPRRLPSSLRDAFASDQRIVIESALEIASLTAEPSLAPDLVRMAEDETSAVRPLSSKALLSIVRILCDSDHSLPGTHVERRQWKATQTRVFECLEKSVERFREHQSESIALAYILLADPRSQFLRRCLRNPREPVMPVLTRILSETDDPQLINGTLVDLLLVPDTSPAILRIWSTRTDQAFLNAFCKRVGRAPNEHVRNNLKRMKSIVWLTGNLAHLERLGREEQIAVLQIIRLSKLDSNDVFRVVEFLLLHGERAVQIAAAEFLEDIRTPTADRLITRLVSHEDPTVQAIALAQMSERNLPGASEQLLQALESEHAIVRNAARRSFPELDMERYLTSFDSQSPESQRATGLLVLKVDSEAIERLQAEVGHGARNRRLRGLQVIELLGLTEECQEAVADCLHDDEYFVRLTAARLFGACRSSFARTALREALMDASASVREAAERALQGMAQILADPFKESTSSTP